MKKLSFIGFYLSLIILFSCKEESKNKAGNISFTDDLGRKIMLSRQPQRFMAISPSLTEMLYLLSDDSEIVGRTQNCNFPPQVLNKPVISNYPVDYEGLLSLRPDIVFAKDGIISMEQASKIEEMCIPVFFQHYDNSDDIFDGIEELGQVLGRETSAKVIADSLRKRKKELEISNKNLPRPKVLMIISADKIFVHGKNSFASDILYLAGGTNVIDSILNNSFPQLSLEYILYLNPDVIIGGEPADLNGTFFNLYPELKKINAYKNKRVYTIDEDILSRPGPRVIDGALQIKKLLHPDA
ncbi:MAG: helical backbone metal receptor [Cytophagaceae bacterium]|nr:helical backbone metal receptor [Cytophagaceae bacterium]